MKKIEEIKKLSIAVFGTFLFAAGMNLFVVSANLYSGGFLGIGQIIRTFLVDIIGLPISGIDIAGIVFYMINIPILVVAYRELGKKFFIVTIICVTMQTLFLTFIPTDIKIMGEEPFISAIIGGVIAGYGVGITLREGGSGGGQDVLGLYLMKKNNKLSVGRIAIMINVCVYTICALMYDLKTVIYSLVYVLVSSYVTDRVHLQNVNVQAMIVTKELDKIVELIKKSDRTATAISGRGCYLGETTDVIITILSKYEARILEDEIKGNGIDAFIVISDVSHVYGKYDKHL